MSKIRSGGRFYIDGHSGQPANGWKVYTFTAGSSGVVGTDDKATFTDYTSQTPQANPIVLDSRGEAEVWWDGTYLIKVHDADDNFLYSLDQYGQGDVSQYVVETKTFAKTITPVDGSLLFGLGTDGGEFIGGTGKAVGYYDDDGTNGSYGTKFKPTGGDGSAGWERDRDDRSVYHSFWFLAVDGGTDDTAALTTAITAMGSAPGTVWLDGDHAVKDSMLHVRYSYQHIKGIKGVAKLRWLGTPTGHPFGVTGGIINFYPSTYVYLTTMTDVIVGNEIEDVELVGLNETVYTAGRQGVIFNGVDEFRCTNNKLSDFGAENILLDPAQTTVASHGAVIEKNHVVGGGNGFNPGNSEGWVCQNNRFEAMDFQGFEVFDGGIFDSNTIYNMVGTVLLTGNKTYTTREDASGLVFSNNRLLETGGMVITSQSGSSPTNMLVDGNTVIRSSGSGIKAASGSETNVALQISNNIVSDNNINGIELISAHPEVIVTGNLVYSGQSGNQTTGINADVNSLAIIKDNIVTGHTLDVNIGGNAVTGHNWTGERFESNSYYKAGGSVQGQSASLATDTAITIFADTDFSTAGSGMLLVNARASASVTGRNSLSLFMAHPSSIGHHTLIQSSGTGPGSAMVVSTAVLTGTTGTAGHITVSVSSTGSSWSAQVENRTGQAISLGWELMGYSR